MSDDQLRAIRFWERFEYFLLGGAIALVMWGHYGAGVAMGAIGGLALARRLYLEDFTDDEDRPDAY